MSAEIEALLFAHRFNKGRAVCHCGAEMGGTGNRGAEHRTHLATLLAAHLIEYLRSYEAERALTNSMHLHVDSHTNSNTPHYFGCDGPCASRAALNAIARQIA